MSADKTVVLITGANRGIGRGLTEAYLARPNHVVIASVRDTSSPSSTSLNEVKPAEGSSLQIVKIEATSETDALEAVEAIKKAGITSIDIAIANSGIAGSYSTIDNANVADFRKFLEVNTIGPLLLYKAVFPLIKAAERKTGTKAPKFLGVSSLASCTKNIDETALFLIGSYGASKAALNHLVRRASFDNKWLNAFLINPGLVQTDMGNDGARFFGMEKAEITVQESVSGIIKNLDEATPETTSGNFYNFDGSVLEF